MRNHLRGRNGGPWCGMHQRQRWPGTSVHPSLHTHSLHWHDGTFEVVAVATTFLSLMLAGLHSLGALQLPQTPAAEAQAGFKIRIARWIAREPRKSQKEGQEEQEAVKELEELP